MYHALNEQFMFQAMEDRTSRIQIRRRPRRRRTRAVQEPKVRRRRDA